MGHNGAAIALIVLAVFIALILIVGITCACTKPKWSGFGGAAFGAGHNSNNYSNRQAVTQGVADTPSQINTNIGFITDQPVESAPDNRNNSGGWGNMETPYAAQAPMAPANDGQWPDSSSPYARYPKMSSEYGRGVANGMDAPSPDDFGYGPTLNVDRLMPASWRKGDSCGDLSEDEAEWARYAPSAGAFDRYITAAGSARLSLNTRSPLARITGTPNLLRQAPKVPVGAFQSEFLDSDFRQSLMFNATGNYPISTDC